MHEPAPAPLLPPAPAPAPEPEPAPAPLPPPIPILLPAPTPAPEPESQPAPKRPPALVMRSPPLPGLMNGRILVMDPKVKEAACSGDVEFLKTIFTFGSSEERHYLFIYFIPIDLSDHNSNLTGNILHLSAANGKVDFFKEVLYLFPKSQSQVLLSQLNKDRLNPLHIAAQLESHKESLEIVKLILEFYKVLHSPMTMMKPWYSLTNSNETPLHLAIKSLNEESALEIMAMDMESFCNKLDRDNNSVLFLAVKNGLNCVAEKILESSCSYSLAGQDNSTPLHYASFSSENILKLLLQKHSALIVTIEDNGTNVLHRWAKIGKAWPLKWLLEEAYKNDLSAAKTKVFSELIWMSDSNGENPLHKAVSTDNIIEFLEYLISGYTQENPCVDFPIWKAKNDCGDTPLHLALSSKQGEAALHILSLDPTLSEIDNDDNESPLFLAIKHGLHQVAETLLKYNSCSVSGPDDYTPLHYAPYSSENVLKLVFEKYPEFIDAVTEEDGYTILHQWAKIGKAWPLIWLLDEDQKKDIPV